MWSVRDYSIRRPAATTQPRDAFLQRAVMAPVGLSIPSGREFWRRACLSTRHPADLIALVGSSGRRVFIRPSQDRVIERLGVAGSWRDRPFLDALA